MFHNEITVQLSVVGERLNVQSKLQAVGGGVYTECAIQISGSWMWCVH